MNELNKEICKRCIDIYAMGGRFDLLKWDNEDEWRWEEYDSVTCYMKGWDDVTIHKIPESCCYKLEHVVMKDKPK